MFRKCCPTGALRSFQAVGIVNRTRHRLDKVYIFGFSKGAFIERPAPCGAFKQMGLRSELDTNYLVSQIVAIEHPAMVLLLVPFRPLNKSECL